MKSGDFVKLKKPKFPAITGQKVALKFWKIEKNGKLFQLEFGAIFKLSAKAGKENGIGNLDIEPYQVLLIDFVKKNKEKFQIIKKEK